MVGVVESTLLAVGTAAGARFAGWLTTGGAIAASVLGAVVLAGTGWAGAGALLTFFATSSALTELRRRVQGGTRSSPRRWVQVLANGGVAAAAAVLVKTGDARAWPAMLASLAAANADTWATEVGRLVGRGPRLVTTLRPVAAGTSGGVTLSGLAASGLGAIVVAAWGPHAVTVGVIGWCAALLDSVIGAVLQARFRCGTCGETVETPTHCGGSATRIAGVSFISNDVVNLLATLIGGVAGYVLVAR